MKPLLLPVLFLFFSISAFTQNYIIPFDSATWVTDAFIYDDANQEYYTICYKYKSYGDTVINDKEYHHIKSDPTFWFGYFRQEGSKVYYLPPAEPYEWNVDNEEYQVFDFSLEEGDSTMLYSLDYGGVDSARVAVTTVDTLVTSDGVERKRIRFNGLSGTNLSPYNSCGYIQWVEGIGANTFQSFYWWASCEGNNFQMSFDCYKVNDFTVLGFCNCETTTPAEEPEEIAVRVYPNPVTEWLNIEISEPFSYRLYDALGNLLIVGTNQKEVNLSFLKKGIYFLNIETENGSVFRKCMKN